MTFAEGLFAVIGVVTVTILGCWALWRVTRWAARRAGLWISKRADDAFFWREEAKKARAEQGRLQRQVNNQRDEIISLQSKVRVTQRERELLRAQVDRLESANVTGRYAFIVKQLEEAVHLQNDSRLQAVGDFAHALLVGERQQ